MRYGIYHVYQDMESDATYQNFDRNGTNEDGYTLLEAMASVMEDVQRLYGHLTIECDGDLSDSHRIVVKVQNDVEMQRWSVYLLST